MTLFIDATWDKEIRLGQEVLEYLGEFAEKVALFASVQFMKLDTVKAQLNNAGIEVLTTKAKRTDKETQILGCDAYHDSFDRDTISECDAILYIGDGMFHPQALLFAQSGKDSKDAVIWDPTREQMKIINKNEINKKVMKYKANLTKYLSSKSIGIIVTMKPGQQFLNKALELKEKLKNEGKKAYVFLDNDINFSHLENYTFIEAWVNTACPRIGMDDIVNITKPLINIREAMNPTGYLEKQQ